MCAGAQGEYETTGGLVLHSDVRSRRVEPAVTPLVFLAGVQSAGVDCLWTWVAQRQAGDPAQRTKTVTCQSTSGVRAMHVHGGPWRSTPRQWPTQ